MNPIPAGVGYPANDTQREIDGRKKQLETSVRGVRRQIKAYERDIAVLRSKDNHWRESNSRLIVENAVLRAKLKEADAGLSACKEAFDRIRAIAGAPAGGAMPAEHYVAVLKQQLTAATCRLAAEKENLVAAHEARKLETEAAVKLKRDLAGVEQQRDTLVRDLRNCAYALWGASMCAGPQHLRDLFEELKNPQPGDLVLETSTFFRSADNPAQGIGTLVSSGMAPCYASRDEARAAGWADDEPIPERLVWDIRLDFDDGRVFRWENAYFIKVKTSA